MWDVELHEAVDEWFCALEPDEAERVAAAIDYLEQYGPTAGRPMVDRLHGSVLHNMKELRPRSSSIRILFVFDPLKKAVLLVAGDKAGKWNDWYPKSIKLAEQRYEEHLKRLEKEKPR